MVKNGQKQSKIPKNRYFFIRNWSTDIVVDTTYIIARKINNIPNSFAIATEILKSQHFMSKSIRKLTI